MDPRYRNSVTSTVLPSTVISVAGSSLRRETSELNVNRNASFHLGLTVDDKEKPS